MADAHSPNDELAPGVDRVAFAFPPAQDDDDGVVMHDDFRLLVRDVTDSHCAVAVLVRLLRGDSSDGLDGADMTGLSVLLEMVQAKLECSVEELGVMSRALGVLACE